MLDLKKIEERVQYVTNQNGEKTAVIVPYDEFQELLEDLEDLAAIVERRDEQTIPHEKVRASLNFG